MCEYKREGERESFARVTMQKQMERSASRPFMRVNARGRGRDTRVPDYGRAQAFWLLSRHCASDVFTICSAKISRELTLFGAVFLAGISCTI